MLRDRFRGVQDRERAIRQAYHAVFASDDGKLVLHDLLQRGGLLETSAVSGDAFMTHFKEGRRSVALEIIHKLRWTEAEMLQLALQRTGDQLAAAQQSEPE